MEDLNASQNTLQLVVDNLPPGGIVSYVTFIEPNKSPSPETLKKVTYLKGLSLQLQKEDRAPLFSGVHVYSVK
jgi:hypothetical protein